MVMSATSIKYAVPRGKPRTRLLTALAARYTGEAVGESDGLLGFDTSQTSQTLTAFGYSLGRTRDIDSL